MSPSESPTTHELIASGQGLVKMLAVRISRRFSGRFELDDLVSFGQLGLVEAANRFNASQGAQFSTFAYYRIRGAIYEGIAQMSGNSRAAFRNTRFSQTAAEILEGVPDLDRETSLRDDVNWFSSMTRELVVSSLLSQWTADPQSWTQIEDSRLAAPDVDAECRESYHLIQAAVSKLPDESKALIEAVYFEGLTLEEAATRIGVSKSWGSRLHRRILKELGNTVLANLED
ncbi:MAG TPA: sigma-70 family RNA polymerase sigma factor [Planctomicrobium sp.]|nr:sigma-70 family RNA polymerase sigma factor [Planctomicrobium sp.]